MTYSIVDSVKGGSGKTCFSLFLAFMKYWEAWNKLSQSEKKDDKKIAALPKFLYFDLDFPGTSIESILYDAPPLVGKDPNEITNITNNTMTIADDGHGTLRIAKRYLNCILNGSYLPEELITSMNFKTDKWKEKTIYSSEGNMKDDGHDSEQRERSQSEDSLQILSLPLDMIISSPYSKDKHRFRGIGNDAINVSQFRYKLSSLLKNVRDMTGTPYTDMVFDMPPGTERYSDCLYDILLFQGDESKASYQLSTDRDQIDIYLMTTLDMSHINATKEYVRSFCRESIHKNINKIRNFYIVINISRKLEEKYRMVPDDRKKLLKSLMDEEFLKGKLKIVFFDYNENYLDTCNGNSYFSSNHEIPYNYLERMADYLNNPEREWTKS